MYEVWLYGGRLVAVLFNRKDAMRYAATQAHVAMVLNVRTGRLA